VWYAQHITKTKDENNSGVIDVKEFEHWYTKFAGSQVSHAEENRQILMNVARIFWKYDTDKTGMLNVNEFKEFYKEIYHKPDVQVAEVSNALQYLDTDKTGNISFAEFFAWLHWWKE